MLKYRACRQSLGIKQSKSELRFKWNKSIFTLKYIFVNCLPPNIDCKRSSIMSISQMLAFRNSQYTETSEERQRVCISCTCNFLKRWPGFVVFRDIQKASKIYCKSLSKKFHYNSRHIRYLTSVNPARICLSSSAMTLSSCE